MASPINPFNINTNPFISQRNGLGGAQPPAIQSILPELFSSQGTDAFTASNPFANNGTLNFGENFGQQFLLPDAGNLGFNEQFGNSINSIFEFINMSMGQIFPGANSNTFNNTQPLAGPSNVNTGPQVNTGNGPELNGIPQNQVNVAVIDNFENDANGFNHGQEITNTILNGGSNAELAGKIDVQQFNVAGQGEEGIANALQQILTNVQNGERLNAVNISLQDFVPDQFTDQIRNTITELSKAGVPVLVAAGNEGINNTNLLGGDGALVVQSTTNGQLNPNSGPGNIQSEGDTTSFATANLTPTIAANHQVNLEQGNGVNETAPATETEQAGETAPAENTPAQQRTQTVKSGDSLSKIAAQHGISWQELYEANKGVIGDDPNLILPGQQLVIPGKDAPANTPANTAANNPPAAEAPAANNPPENNPPAEETPATSNPPAEEPAEPLEGDLNNDGQIDPTERGLMDIQEYQGRIDSLRDLLNTQIGRANEPDIVSEIRTLEARIQSISAGLIL